jgi:hypothetical protein
VPKRSHGLFSRLTKLRARVKRIKNDVTRLAAIAIDKDLKMQLRTARDLLLEADDMMTPASEHQDQELRVQAAAQDPTAAATPATAATS